MGRETSEHKIWRLMLSRCRNPRDSCYRRWGGRGITVCERWDSFESFLSDMGQRPGPEYTLDRVDNDGPYCPENCRWATVEEQANNRRNNRRVECQGRTLTVAQWARESGIDQDTLWARLNAGWPPQRAIWSPLSEGLRLELDGLELTVPEWADRVGISASSLYWRLSHGWAIPEALETPAYGVASSRRDRIDEKMRQRTHCSRGHRLQGGAVRRRERHGREYIDCALCHSLRNERYRRRLKENSR